jgi:hypothetical protein
MKNSRIWIAGLLATFAVIAVPVVVFLPKPAAARDNPQAALPQQPIHTSHVDLMAGPYKSGPEVTRACLTCHPDAASDADALDLGEQAFHRYRPQRPGDDRQTQPD